MIVSSGFGVKWEAFVFNSSTFSGLILTCCWHFRRQIVGKGVSLPSGFVSTVVNSGVWCCVFLRPALRKSSWTKSLVLSGLDPGEIHQVPVLALYSFQSQPTDLLQQGAAGRAQEAVGGLEAADEKVAGLPASGGKTLWARPRKPQGETLNCMNPLPLGNVWPADVLGPLGRAAPRTSVCPSMCPFSCFHKELMTWRLRLSWGLLRVTWHRSQALWPQVRGAPQLQLPHGDARLPVPPALCHGRPRKPATETQPAGERGWPAAGGSTVIKWEKNQSNQNYFRPK